MTIDKDTERTAHHIRANMIAPDLEYRGVECTAGNLNISINSWPHSYRISVERGPVKVYWHADGGVFRDEALTEPADWPIVIEAGSDVRMYALNPVKFHTRDPISVYPDQDTMPGLEDAATIALDKLISIVAEQIYDEAPVSTGSGSDFTYGFDELPKEYVELKSSILAEARSRIAAACLL